MSRLTSILLLSGLLWTAPSVLAVVSEDEVQQVRPSHDRPYFMPAEERQRIQGLVRKEPWAKTEYARVRAEAEKGNGFWAGFLYALDGDEGQLDTAREYLMGAIGPESWNVRHYSKLMADPNHFKAGAPHLGPVYYHLDFRPFVVFDWVYRGLSDDDRKMFTRGIEVYAEYRMRAMDRWYQTPNLVFKPTFMVAMAGLSAQDDEMLQWGLFRTKPHGKRLGGYFPVLDYMLRDGGPWHEATIYPIAHEDLWCMSILSRYGKLYDGRDWFAMTAPGGGSPKGLMDYYIETAYPIERTGHGAGQIRVATYGDGATSPGGDLFLVNPAGDGLNAEKAFIAAYNASGDARYAGFMRMIKDYQPNLWDQRPVPEKAELPAAPSKIWPTYGLAILRSDESPAYWTSGRAIAVFQLMSQGYGHDHRDKFAIMLHGAGRLLYPDYNAIQYESSAIGWTRHTCSHNTLIVDEQDTANAQPTAIRHEFSPEVKYLATSAEEVFEGVKQTRVLLLTGEYLLDVFHARSELPHTYDYMLHCFGEARPVGPACRAGPEHSKVVISKVPSGSRDLPRFRPAANLMSRYWVIENKQAMSTDQPWSFDFVHKETPDSRPGNYGPPWYDHTANVRVSMTAEPETQVVHGIWGKQYEKLVAERYKDKKRLDRLSSLVVRRDQRPETVFIATHEPYANGERPQIRRITKLAESAAAVLVRVEADQFTDYAAVSFGPQPGRPVHVLGDGKATVQFRDYAYARVDRAGRVTARGDVLGLRIPGARGPLVLAGEQVPAAQQGGALVHLTARATAAPEMEPRCPLKVTPSPTQLRVWTRDHKSVSLSVSNTLRKRVTGRIEFDLPDGITTDPASPEFGPVGAGKTATAEAEFHVFDPQPGKLTIPYRVVYREEDSAEEIRTQAQPLVAYAGPTLEQRFQFPKPPVYRAVTSWYTAQMRMSDGAFIYLADDSDRVRLAGEPLFLLSEGEGDQRVDMLGPEPQKLGVWPGHQPPNVVAEAYGRTENRSQRCRWQAIFMVNSIMFRMDPDWSRFETARFTLPGNWRSSGGKPQWRRIVAVDGRGKERESRPGSDITVAAALLGFPDGDYHLAFQFTPPQKVTFRDAGMEFTVGVVNRDSWRIGFCKRDQFDQWRGKP